MMAEPAGGEMPIPETDELGRYLEDTITIDWQTPDVMSTARMLLDALEEPEARIRRLFTFVRDEIADSLDTPTAARTCRASEVLRERTGLCYARSHLLAALLRFAGFPAGFCYARWRDDDRPGRFVLHGFNAVYLAAKKDWVHLDLGCGSGGMRTECRLSAPWSLARWPDAEAGEAFLPFIYKRPGKRIIDLFERAPDFEAVRRNLPDALT